MKTDGKRMLHTTGLTLITGGLIVMSPLDEMAVASATGGIGAAAAPVQAPATFVLGLASVAVGAFLLKLASE